MASPPDHRHLAREAALQMLYAIELGGQSVSEVEGWYLQSHPLDPAVREMASRLLEHVAASETAIAALLLAHVHGWKPERLSVIDRSVLKLAIAELIAERETPAPVIIHEALRLGKKFSQPEAVAFLNGVLDAVSKQVRPRTPAGSSPAGS